MTDQPPICDYENSDYQTRFWEQADRAYEDAAEAVALRHLLAGASGEALLEIGAGAGRNTPRYHGYRKIVLLDYSRTMLRQAQERLGNSDRYIFVAGNAYTLPFQSGVFDAATMIRVLHHMAQPAEVLHETARVLRTNGIFILEFANKRNLKAILRWLLRRQGWNPFSPEPVEFAPLNFDFHPRRVWEWLESTGFEIEQIRTVSHYRHPIFKKLVPLKLLVALDALAQPTGKWWQLSPSVFVRARLRYQKQAVPLDFPAAFRCPRCGSSPLEDKGAHLFCPTCGARWRIHDGIYDFKEPM